MEPTIRDLLEQVLDSHKRLLGTIDRLGAYRDVPPRVVHADPSNAYRCDEPNCWDPVTVTTIYHRNPNGTPFIIHGCAKHFDKLRQEAESFQYSA